MFACINSSFLVFPLTLRYAYWKVCTRVLLCSLNNENMSFIAMKYREFLKVRKVKKYNKTLDLLDNLRVKLVVDIPFGTS